MRATQVLSVEAESAMSLTEFQYSFGDTKRRNIQVLLIAYTCPFFVLLHSYDQQRFLTFLTLESRKRCLAGRRWENEQGETHVYIALRHLLYCR